MNTTVESLTRDKREELSTNIRMRLAEYRLTQVWLIQKLTHRGLNMDKSEMSSILSGTRTGSKVDEVLRQSVEILDSYSRQMPVGQGK